ncbi:MAG: M20/M25/M40 family metallo-hydrolase [Planctomycetes bacterium]|nr:M20/M25/M40 family metallo-hydrolase [Planctomycetota bacterium]
MERLVRNVLDWVAIPSVTGSEHDYGEALARECARIGLAVERQELQPGRANVLARGGRPRVVLCTHLDTVPGDLGVREDREHVHGRGACDAKGPAAALLQALERLLASGEDRVGALFTVGEETDSAGAALANARLAEPWEPAYTVIGEPTDNRFVAAGKGIWKARLVATGSAGHSSQDAGPSAVHELVRCVHGLLQESWGTHPVLGPGTLNVGTIQGGVAPNVVAEHAECEVLVRAVEDPSAIQARVARHLGPRVRVEKTHKGYGPIEFGVPPGEAGIPVAFGTDAPHLVRWGQPLLFGPGSILDAHTDHEKVSKRALFEAAARYERLARELLSSIEPG